MSRADNQTTIWQVDAVNELGLPTLIRQGDNTLNTTYTYDNYYHLSGISNYRQNDTYVWDANNGNLSSRSNHIKNLTETFEYDDLNRLTEIRLNNVLVKEMSYASNGNIETKTDAGEYLYDPVMVHAVKQIEGDENTAISGAPQEVAYTAFNKIKTIVEKTANGDSLVYLYGPDMQRNRMELYDSSNLLKSRVYDGLYETETRDNDLIEYCYIEGGNGITAVMITTGINNTMYYLLRDQQGSITGLVDNQRNLVEEYSYDAWGRRRNPNTWAYDNTPVPQFMFRGYTMHEMLDEFALINMNGRCYDPVVGRFLSPDIIIQDGNNTQCYNKYSYCINNPLKYTDPSGWKVDRNWYHNHIAISNWWDLDRILYKLQHQWRNVAGDALLNSFIELRGCNNLEGQMNASSGGIDFLDQYANDAKMQKSIWTHHTMQYKSVYDEETNSTRLSFYKDGKIVETRIYEFDKERKPTIDNTLNEDWIYILPNAGKDYQIIALPPKGKFYDDVDGIATQKYSNVVFKIPDGGSVTVDDNGEVSLSTWGNRVMGWMVQHFSGASGSFNQKWSWGWRDKAQFSSEDLRNGWGDLFNSLDTYHY